MDELYYVFATAALIIIYFFAQVIGGKFDPFAPIWLFMVGYIQPYIIQATSYHEWAVGARGKEIVAAANFRSFWALLWLLVFYHLGVGRIVATFLPQPPRRWSPTLVAFICPPLIAWGLLCAGVVLRGGGDESTYSAEESLFRSFPFVMMVAAVLLIVTGRTIHSPSPKFLPAGLAIALFYVLIWMFNGKRSHALIGVLSTVCAFYCTRLRRPSWPVLIATAFTGALVVAIAIGWRMRGDAERSLAGFLGFLGEFKASTILESLNISDGEDDGRPVSYESTEYGGFLLMMDTVPLKSDYDYGANYLRMFSTFIPRLIWPSKPVFGRAQWINAWIEGSEMERDEQFTGPSIGIMGATQLNGGTVGTLIVMACIGLLLRMFYEYFRLYADRPWAQFWWSITYYNAWFMVLNDDPLVWFYYNWGFTTFPIVVLMWFGSKFGGSAAEGRLVAQAAS